MSDTESNASFEDIHPHVAHQFDVVTSSNAVKYDKAAAKFRGDTDDDKVEDYGEDTPDVLYVLQYKEFGNNIEVRRSHEPIDVDLGRAPKGKSAAKGKAPVIEIVTVVSTSLVTKQPRHGIPLYQPGYPRPGGGVYPSHPNWGHGDHGSGELKVTKVENTIMKIHSAHLKNALRAVVGYYPGTSFVGNEVQIEAPYYPLFHNKEALTRYKFNQPSGHDAGYASTTAQHIDALLGFLDKTYGQQIEEEEKRHTRTMPTATFEFLWLLLQPGEVIYAHHDHCWTPFVISRVFKKTSASPDGQYGYHIDCWNYKYSNRELTRCMHTIDIAPFSGEEAINNLPAIPARFFTGADGDMEPEEVTAEHIRHGKAIWELCKGPSYHAYDGELAKKSPFHGWDYSVCPTGYMSGRVVIDPEGYERFSNSCPLGRNRGHYGHPPPPNQPAPPYDQLPHFAPRCGCAVCQKEDNTDDLSPWTEFDNLDPVSDDPPESDLYFHVLQKVVAGFTLGDRRWGHFHIGNLIDIKFDKEAFKYLVLDDDIKMTLRALIGKFSSKDGHVSAWPNDFVKNKGQGRIFLLHGSPGVGKTCTAECVAELTHRPLLSLTSGDLSTQSNHVERNLEYFLQLGERFGAMVLLDEADVYLETRRARDIARNGLVSVFLRALEYYRGVLFLTTNRVQTFDAAFQSRIHVALHYGPLTDTDRERIWTNSFQRLEKNASGRVQVTVTAREYAWGSADIRSLRWNGREIRNALQTAVALAESEAMEDGSDTVIVADTHLRAVVRMSRGFKNFLRRKIRDDESEGGDIIIDDVADDDDEGVEDEEASFSDSSQPYTTPGRYEMRVVP